MKSLRAFIRLVNTAPNGVGLGTLPTSGKPLQCLGSILINAQDEVLCIGATFGASATSFLSHALNLSRKEFVVNTRILRLFVLTFIRLVILYIQKIKETTKMCTAIKTRFSVRCNGCKKMMMAEAVHYQDFHGMACQHCARTMSPRMQGTFEGVRYVFCTATPVNHKKIAEPTKCGARCRSACGPNCDCECGGEFHGIDSVRAS